MNISKIHSVFASGCRELIVTILFIVVMRLLTGVELVDDPVFWFVLALQIGIALFLLQFSNNYLIIREKTMLPAVFYLLLTGIDSTSYLNPEATAISLCCLICLHLLFRSYQNPDSQKDALNISLLLTLCSLMWQQALFFFPLVWYGFYRLRCLNYKTFFATIIGVLTVYLFIFTWMVYIDRPMDFLNFLPQKQDLLMLQPLLLTSREWALCFYFVIMFFVSGFSLYIINHTEKVRTSTFLHYLYFLSVVVFVLLMLQSKSKTNWAMALYVPMSLLLAYCYTLSRRKIVGWILILNFVFFLGLYLWQWK
ncbi:MAG: hypothetical protein LBR67_00595 [Dysgonamonadaceae bacterium]|nr:hypothetical protein [Dysgonamonadaceae bacterium]